MTARVPAVLINGRVANLPSADHLDPGTGGTVRTPLVLVDGHISELAPADSLQLSSGGSSHRPLVLIDGHVTTLPAGDSIATGPARSLVDRGEPITSSEQFCPSLSPNAAGDDWNYIVASWTGVNPQPIEWVVIKNLTTDPDPVIFDTTTHHYPNALFLLPQGTMLRAGNGRIFFPLFGNNFAYYDPTTETVTEFGPFAETPSVPDTTSTIPYSASFDTAGMLYFATQESQHRPSCVVSVDPNTLEITVLGYVGETTMTYTTYGYSIAPDTATEAKYVYVAYGEDPWQLWALEIATGTATKLYEVPGTGHISFTNIAGKGWVAQCHTNLGAEDDSYTQHWCLDGAICDYVAGVDPTCGTPRNVTPASNPLVDPPELDTSRGIGSVGWRSGTSGPFTYVDYEVVNRTAEVLELLVTAPDGILIGSQGYNGFVRYNAASHTGDWFGVESGATIAQPLALYVPALGNIFLAGYPDGVLLDYDPTAAWSTYPAQTNPALPGYYGPSGTVYAGIKFVGDPNPPTTVGAGGSLVWSASASAGGRLYCAGTRERTGTGAGIGYWDKGTNAFAGTFASPLDSVVAPTGLVALNALGQIVMSTRTASAPVPLFVFDYDLTLVATQYPLGSTASALGQIFPTGNSEVVCGVYAASGSLALYRWNVQSGTLVQGVSTTFEGAIDATTINQADGSIWIAVGNSIVRVDPDTLAVTREVDITSIAPVSCLAFYGTELYMSSNTTLWSC